MKHLTMKHILENSFRRFILCLFLLFAAPLLAFASENEPPHSISVDGLTIRSFSDNWDEEALSMVYDELRNNFHAGEFESLSRIDLYPDGDVLGYYFEDIRVNADGEVYLGDQCYIELYRVDQYEGIEDLAPALAHEYGHHYTIFNITQYEGKYYTGWDDSEYARVRELSRYDISYTYDNYDYLYDIAEIAANDYVQLLGSCNARLSYDYKDAVETLAAGEDQNRPVYFNMRPQQNCGLPLATEVDGLYEYFLKIAGYSHTPPEITMRPQILGVDRFSFSSGDAFTLSFSGAKNVDEDRFEYTVIMYPKDMPQDITPIKTLIDGEDLIAVFGTVVYERPDKTVIAVLDSYAGEYAFKVYAKDYYGRVFSSSEFLYDFGGATQGAHALEMDTWIEIDEKEGVNNQVTRETVESPGREKMTASAVQKQNNEAAQPMSRLGNRAPLSETLISLRTSTPLPENGPVRLSWPFWSPLRANTLLMFTRRAPKAVYSSAVNFRAPLAAREWIVSAFRGNRKTRPARYTN